MKHALLARLLTHLNAKPTPYLYLDSHAGIGIYDLTSEAATRTGEWQDGIGKFATAQFNGAESELFRPYFGCLQALRERHPENYPGSPELARFLSRKQDRLILSELHPNDAALLRRNFSSDTRVKTLEIDGWISLKAQLPPPERRGLVLIDPPFESIDEFQQITAALVGAYRKWRTGIYAIWYPIKDISKTQRFLHDLQQTDIRKILKLELLLGSPLERPGLAGSGLIIVNPPWKLAEEAQIMLPALARHLGSSPGASTVINWLTPE